MITESFSLPVAEGRRTKTEEWTSSPVTEVMLGEVSLFCESRDLILLETISAEGVDGSFEHEATGFFFGKKRLQLLPFFVEEGMWFDGEVVER